MQNDIDFMEEVEAEEGVSKKKGAAKGKGTKGVTKTPTETIPPSSNQTGEKRKSIAVEDKYKKMEQKEHILKRPDTYSRFSYDISLGNWCCVSNSWKCRKVNSGNVGV